MAKKLTKAERKEARLRKGKQWLLTYTGSPKKVNKHYRERFHVDAVTAAKDLQELGVNYTQEQLDQIKRAEEQRLRQRRMEREAKERERLAELYKDCDGRFAFIAGYTDGGAPYGVMWEEVGIGPGLPFEEKVKLQRNQIDVSGHRTGDLLGCITILIDEAKDFIAVHQDFCCYDIGLIFRLGFHVIEHELMNRGGFRHIPVKLVMP